MCRCRRCSSPTLRPHRVCTVRILACRRFPARFRMPEHYDKTSISPNAWRTTSVGECRSGPIESLLLRLLLADEDEVEFVGFRFVVVVDGELRSFFDVAVAKGR